MKSGSKSKKVDLEMDAIYLLDDEGKETGNWMPTPSAILIKFIGFEEDIYETIASLMLVYTDYFGIEKERAEVLVRRIMEATMSNVLDKELPHTAKE